MENEIPYTKDLINRSFEFRGYKPDVHLNKTAHRLIESNSYLITWKMVFHTKKRCDLCGNEEKANEIVEIIENPNTENTQTLQGGLDCLKDKCQVDLRHINKRVGTIALKRQEASRLFGIELSGSEELRRVIEDQIHQFAPDSIRPLLLERLAFSLEHLGDDKDADLIFDIIQFAGFFFRRATRNIDFYKATLYALMSHPALGRETDLFMKAINSKDEIDWNDIQALHQAFAKVAKWKPLTGVLVNPQDAPDEVTYLSELKSKVFERVFSDNHKTVDGRYWEAALLQNLPNLFSRQQGFISLAIFKEDEAIYLERLRKIARQLGYGVFVFYCDDQHFVDVVEPNLRKRVEEQTSRRYSYSIMGSHLVEKWTPTFALWQEWGKERLINIEKE